jgi:type IV secretion system protein VirB9
MIIRSIFFSILIVSIANFSYSNEPVAIDSRIKTLIYTKNQIFRIEANYGYQSFIEFAENEKIKTIAVGDNVSWSINPAANKVFLRPFEKEGKTNMTVITDKRTYVFDLIARSDSDSVDKNLTYIVRFYYPEKQDEFSIGVDPKNESNFSFNGKTYNVNYNNLHHNYSAVGDKSIEPLEVFDNSNVTFFRFKSKKIPRIFIINRDKSETQVKMVEFKNYIVIDGVHKKLHLRYKNLVTIITNNDI